MINFHIEFMKKLYAIVLFFLIVISFLVFYLSFFGFQIISTDKDVYSVGEEIKIYWFDLSLEWCTCSDKEVKIFKQEEEGWKEVDYQLKYRPDIRYEFIPDCVEGKIIHRAMPCDVTVCGFPRLKTINGNFTWNSKIYERIGTTNFCVNPHTNETINGIFNNYTLKYVSPGKYKIIFGNAQKVIEIA